MLVFVISKDGERLMPTQRCGKVRRLLKDGRAVIVKRNPFTIQLTYDTTNYTQPIELCQDTGYSHIGVSVKSNSKEYISEQLNLLPDEKQRHDDCRKLRKTRRNRLRYRAPRFDNRRTSEGWLAPSIKNKADCHIRRIGNYLSVCPVTDIYVEVGTFDTQVLKAYEEGNPIPVGEDYQKGECYSSYSLREATFKRDNYTCVICGRTIKDGAVLHAHHALFWQGRHGNSLSEMATVCEKCHTSKNHQKNGKLWGYEPKVARLEGASFMNSVRWYIFNTVKTMLPDNSVHYTYGAATKMARRDLDVEKTHLTLPLRKMWECQSV